MFHKFGSRLRRWVGPQGPPGPTPSVEAIVPVLVPAIVPVLVPEIAAVLPLAQVGVFTCPATIGNYSVTGLGFKPKSVAFFVSKAPGLQTHFCCCQGVMDQAGNQCSMTWAGVWSNTFKGDSRQDKCIYTINSSGISQVTASYVSMDDDGFTLDFLAVNPVFNVQWLATG